MIDHIHRFTIPATYALLPPAMASDKATGLLLAIGLQESAFLHRRQFKGPARGFWQFELNGVKGVLRHPRTTVLADTVIDALRYTEEGRGPAQTAAALHIAMAYDSTLACGLARLLLWTLPRPLPGPQDVDEAWQQYVSCWKPGRPERAQWDHHYAEAWARVVAARPAGDLDDES
jgi:hypothetical protein